MDLRAVFIQELLRISDFADIQRKTLRALTTLAFGTLGGNTIAAVIPSTGSIANNALATNPSGLTARVPPISLYQLADLSTAAFSGLGADTTKHLIQGMNIAATDFLVTVPGFGNQQYYIIEAELGTPVDENPVVLPFFPMIQATTIAGSTTSKIYLSFTTGIGVGDQIVVSGIAAVGGVPTFVATIGSDGGGAFITLTIALTSAPGSGVTVRDVNPNSGVPLSGPINSGSALNIDRNTKVSLFLKAGSQAVSATVPPVTSGRIGLYTIGPVLNGSVNLTGLIALYTGAQPDGRTGSPFFPGLVNVGHHHGNAGESSKIDVNSELSQALVKLAGDTMTGPLISPEVRVNDGDGYNFSGARADPVTEGISGIKLNTAGFMEFVSGLALRWQQPGAAFAPITVARILVGSYIGDGTLSRTIGVGFIPSFVLIIPQGVPNISTAHAVMLYTGSARLLSGDASQGLTGSVDQQTFIGQLALGGFTTGSLSLVINQNNQNYLWIALG